MTAFSSQGLNIIHIHERRATRLLGAQRSVKTTSRLFKDKLVSCSTFLTECCLSLSHFFSPQLTQTLIWSFQIINSQTTALTGRLDWFRAEVRPSPNSFTWTSCPLQGHDINCCYWLFSVASLSLEPQMHLLLSCVLHTNPTTLRVHLAI